MNVGDEDASWFEKEKLFHETRYLAGSNPRLQSGFGRDERDWERFRRPVVAAIRKNGTFLDVGCASGLLMEDVGRWSRYDGYVIEPYGVDISEKLVALARQRLPHWRDRIFIGNALHWEAPFRFDYVRTELVYVPDYRRRQYVERLLARVVAPGGYAILCSYGSSRPEGMRAEPLLDEVEAWDLEVGGNREVVSPEHGFIITQVVWVKARA
jgi:SAM-dependent methyltransferase